jgi:hypothetical protein
MAASRWRWAPQPVDWWPRSTMATGALDDRIDGAVLAGSTGCLPVDARPVERRTDLT